MHLKNIAILLPLAALSTIAAVALLMASLDLPAEKAEYFKLAEIAKDVTGDVKKSDVERMREMSDWLAVNVRWVPEYPDWFDTSSPSTVIAGGVGNCGYQAYNIIAFAQLFGIQQYRRYWIGAPTGAETEHAFAEVRTSQGWAVFDATWMQHAVNSKGHPASLVDMLNFDARPVGADKSAAPVNWHPGIRKMLNEIRADSRKLTLTRPYVLYVPASFDTWRRWPLVVEARAYAESFPVHSAALAAVVFAVVCWVWSAASANWYILRRIHAT